MGYKQTDGIIPPIKVLEYNREEEVVEFVDQITTYTSLRFTQDFQGIGSFTLELSGNNKKSGSLKQGRIIQYGNYTSKQGIIMDVNRKLTTSADGKLKNLIIISGVQLKGLLGYTLTVPPVYHDPTVFPTEPGQSRLWQNTVSNKEILDISTDDTEIVYALTEDTLYKINSVGSVVWSYSEDGETFSSLTVYLSTSIYVGTTSGKLYNIDDDGTVKMDVDVPRVFTVGTNKLTSLTFFDTEVIYSSDSEGNIKKTESDGTTTSIVTDTANYINTLKVDEYYNLYVAEDSGRLVKYNTSGTQSWVYDGHEGSVNDIDLTTDRQVLSAGQDGNVTRLNTSGVVQWTYSDHTGPVSSVTIGSTLGYVYSTDTNGFVKTLDYMDGLEHFSYKDSITPTRSVFKPDETESTLFVGTQEGYVLKLTISDVENESYEVVIDSSGYPVERAVLNYKGTGSDSHHIFDSQQLQDGKVYWLESKKDYWDVYGEEGSEYDVSVGTELEVFTALPEPPSPTTVKGVIGRATTFGRVFVTETERYHYYVATYPKWRTESIIRELVKYNLQNSILFFKNTPEIQLEDLPDDHVYRGTNHEQEAFRFNKLSESIEYLCEKGGLGWNLIAENGRFVLKIYESVERTTTQSQNNSVVFSFNRGNIRDVDYSENISESYNQLIIAGRGDGIERDLIVVGDFSQQGLDSRLGFVDARDVKSIDGLSSRSKQKIAERRASNSIQVTGFSKKSLTRLNEEFEIGDTVTVRLDDWGIIMNVQIMGVTERQTLNNAGSLDFTFGTDRLSLENLLKRNFDEIQNEILK